MTEPDKPEQTPSAPPPPPPVPPNPAQQQAYPQQPYPQQPYQQQAYPQQQQPYPQQPYGYPPAAGGYTAPPPSPKNGIGIASLVVAIVSLLTVFGGVLLGLIAIVLGVIGRGRAKRGEATNGGIALAGIVLGLLSVIVSIVAIVLTVQFVKDVGAGDLYDCMQQAGSDSAAQQDCQDQFQQNLEDQFSITLTPTP